MTTLKVGDYVQIKDGIALETGEVISNWAGKITEMYPEYKTCLVELDSITLNSLDDNYLLECVEDGVEPFDYIFEWEDLTISARRDTEKERKLAIERIEAIMMEMADGSDDEYDEDEQTKWVEEFHESKYFETLNEYQKQNAGFIADTFMHYMYNYEYVSPEGWDAHNVKSVCVHIVPSKVTAEIELFENYADVLLQFFKFLDEKGYITASEEIQKAVKETKDEIPKKASNPSNWGMAKSFMMGAQDAGVDFSDEQELNSFLENYDQQLQAELDKYTSSENPLPIKEDPFRKIGRNDKITVKYSDETILENIKFKKVKQDLLDGKCELMKK
jgi:hypothetical protein